MIHLKTVTNADELLKKENLLLDKWAKSCQGLVRDGMINPDEYIKAPLRILYLLKEVNGGADWDLRSFVREGGRKQTWDNIARWTKGIRAVPDEIPWEQLENITEEERRAILQQICAVNIKKTSGTYTADKKRITEAAGRDAEYLKKQINLYEPDIIICCGTEWNYWHEIMKTEPDWKETSRGIWYFIENTSRIVVSYVHPEARVKDCLLYYGLVDCMREILALEGVKAMESFHHSIGMPTSMKEP